MPHKLSLPLLLVLSSPLLVQAFPPAPYYTLYGTVHDQVGQTLAAEGATLVLLSQGVEIGRTPISPTVINDQTYELNVRIDQNRSGTTLYTEKALAPTGAFSLLVEMNGLVFYPIEVAGNLTAGNPGERVRLDLNLGADSDKDGLPDVWEQWQLYQAGYATDAQGKWPINLIDKNGDLDKDGLTNWQEYVAGTFAGDATEKFGLTIKEKQSASVRFEFYSITGKTYTIESSPDNKTWTKVSFSVGSLGVGQPSHRATGVGVLSAYTATAPANAKEFYRLTVR